MVGTVCPGMAGADLFSDDAFLDNSLSQSVAPHIVL